MSGIDFHDETGNVIRSIRKGAVDAIKRYITLLGGQYPDSLDSAAQSIAKNGGTRINGHRRFKIVGIVELRDIIKGGIKERFIAMRQMG